MWKLKIIIKPRSLQKVGRVMGECGLLVLCGVYSHEVLAVIEFDILLVSDLNL